jgi:putative ABC transport system substrate-binding protein
MRVQFWGTRGSIAKPGPSTARYGGNTSCIEVRSARGTLVVVDCRLSFGSDIHSRMILRRASCSGFMSKSFVPNSRRGDPVALGLVASLNHPGGNLTGTTTLTLEVGQKWLQLLHEMVPTATTFALLVNPTSPNLAEAQSLDLQKAARALGLQIHSLQASTDQDFDTVFATLVKLRAGGLVISSDSFFFTRSEQLAALAARHAVPAIFGFREFAAAGGLMSYGASVTDQHRTLGVYTGRILKGEKPSDLPVQQATKVELIINLKTAKALGLEVPPMLLARADEVIE